jgi:hypothetical protein
MGAWRDLAHEYTPETAAALTLTYSQTVKHAARMHGRREITAAEVRAAYDRLAEHRHEAARTDAERRAWSYRGTAIDTLSDLIEDLAEGTRTPCVHRATTTTARIAGQ